MHVPKRYHIMEMISDRVTLKITKVITEQETNWSCRICNKSFRELNSTVVWNSNEDILL